MPLELALSPRRALSEHLAPQWRQPLAQLALAWLGLIALFASDWAAMARQWWDSSTYNHVLLVPAILVWLAWQRAGELAKLTPRAWWPGLVPLAGALLIWLLGDVSGTATASQLGAVLMLQAAVLVVLGPRIGWALLFPLAYALFLVPIGDELVPALQAITAHITIELTLASGVPAMIDGVFIDTPVGLFEVAEACSGVKFLIAMIALGALVAHVCFRSWMRRAIFMTVAVVLPILANGVRAWGTIYIAQSQGLEFAAGFDHIFYGFVFFGLVMAALLAISWRFFDRRVDDRYIDGAVLANSPVLDALESFAFAGRTALAAIAGFALLALLWSAQARALEAYIPDSIALPDVPGWEMIEVEQSWHWLPRAGGANHRVWASYRNDSGEVVDLFYALYSAQEEGREASAFGEGAVPPDSHWRWLASSSAPQGGRGEILQAMGVHRRVAYSWYRHGDWLGGSTLRLKLETMRDRLLLDARPTAMLIVAAEDGIGQDGAAAANRFISATGPLDEWMDRVGAGR